MQSLYQPKPIKKYQNFLTKGFKDQSIGMSMKQKVRTKILKIRMYISSNQTDLELTDCLW